jgi:hypothetical protein
MQNDTTITHILPRTLNGFPVDVTPADVGGFEILIWKDTHRNDGIMVHVATLGDVVRFFRDVQRKGAL